MIFTLAITDLLCRLIIIITMIMRNRDKYETGRGYCRVDWFVGLRRERESFYSSISMLLLCEEWNKGNRGSSERSHISGRQGEREAGERHENDKKEWWREKHNRERERERVKRKGTTGMRTETGETTKLAAELNCLYGFHRFIFI